MWPLTPFTDENGATRMYPFSHGIEGMAKEDPGPPVVAECQPGSAICFLGSPAHGAGANIPGDVRRGIVIGSSLGVLKPYAHPWLAYPPDLTPNFPPALAPLPAYAHHRPHP